VTRGDLQEGGLGGDDQRNSESHRLDGGESEPLEVGREDHEARRSELFVERIL
jgi:hypothetical protein